LLIASRGDRLVAEEKGRKCISANYGDIVSEEDE
jgi:hypothetical protein